MTFAQTRKKEMPSSHLGLCKEVPRHLTFAERPGTTRAQKDLTRAEELARLARSERFLQDS